MVKFQMDCLFCHKCNNPPCCNPRHLYAGTYLDNTRDKIAAGTQYKIPPQRGLKCPASKLNEEQVKLIRESDIKGVELARMFGVTKSAISRVRKGLSWKTT